MGKDDEDNLVFNSIVIVESLDSEDRKTGRILHDYINALDSNNKDVPVKATYIPITSRAAFIDLIDSLIDQAKTRRLLPILHIEAHGNESQGIYFADNSNLEWDALCDLLTPLNEATGFQLSVVVAACYGDGIISGVRLSKPAPCFALIGPTNTISEPEVQGVFRDFYGTVLRTLDLGAALKAMAAHTLGNGSVTTMTASVWFEMLMTKYLREETTPKAFRQSALRQYLKLREDGRHIPIGDLKRNFRRELPKIVRRYFDTFFMIGRPASMERYRSLWERIQVHMTEAARR